MKVYELLIENDDWDDKPEPSTVEARFDAINRKIQALEYSQEFNEEFWYSKQDQLIGPGQPNFDKLKATSKYVIKGPYGDMFIVPDNIQNPAVLYHQLKKAVATYTNAKKMFNN